MRFASQHSGRGVAVDPEPASVYCRSAWPDVTPSFVEEVATKRRSWTVLGRQQHPGPFDRPTSETPSRRLSPFRSPKAGAVSGKSNEQDQDRLEKQASCPGEADAQVRRAVRTCGNGLGRCLRAYRRLRPAEGWRNTPSTSKPSVRTGATRPSRSLRLHRWRS